MELTLHGTCNGFRVRYHVFEGADGTISTTAYIFGAGRKQAQVVGSGLFEVARLVEAETKALDLARRAGPFASDETWARAKDAILADDED